MLAIGLDFGTSNSVMARVADGRARLLRDAEGRDKTPSVVYFGDPPLVGADALDVLADSYADEEQQGLVVQSIKRQLLYPSRIALPGGRIVRPREVVTAVLAKLRADAEQSAGERVTRAVITRPAVFDLDQQRVIAEAAADAGFDECELLDEPVAAAMAFAHSGGDVGHGILVYDFGGGTFDVAFVAREPDGDRFYLALEPDGDAECGGDDLDQLLYEHFDAEARRTVGRSIGGDGAVDRAFLLMCRRRKESLSKTTSATFSTLLGGQARFTSVIDRATFEGLIGPTVERTVTVTRRLADRARAAGHTVDTILLVGGSSQIPLVRERIAAELGITPQSWAHRDAAVALGAAHHATLVWPARPAVALSTTPAAAQPVSTPPPASAVPARPLLVHQRDDLPMIMSVGVSADCELVALGCFDMTAVVLRVADGQEVCRVQHPGGLDEPVSDVSFSGDGTRLATVGGEPVARVWDIPSGRPVAALEDSVELKSVCVSPDGRQVATGRNYLAEAYDAEDAVRVWDLDAMRPRLVLATSSVDQVIYDPVGTVLYVVGLDRIQIFDTGLGAMHEDVEYEEYLHQAAVSADGVMLAVCGKVGSWLYDLSADGAEWQLTTGDTLAMAVNGDGTRAATLEDDQATIWDVRKRRAIGTVDMGYNSLIELTPDGRHLITAGVDVSVWEL